MRSVHPFDDVFAGRSHIKVLRALCQLPTGASAGVRELARRAGVSHPTASAVLDSLRQTGLVTVSRSSISDGYRFEPEHFLAGVLGRMFARESEMFDDLVALLEGHISSKASWVSAAWLFGSAARGDLTPDSDIDMALICPASRAGELETIMEDLSDETKMTFGNRVQAVVATRPIREMTKRGSGSALWRVIEKEGIPLRPMRDHAAAG